MSKKAKTDNSYLALTPAGALMAHANQQPNEQEALLQSLLLKEILQLEQEWLAVDSQREAFLQTALEQNWIYRVSKPIQAPDAQLDDFLPRAIAGLSGKRLAALASEEGFCLAKVGFSQQEAETLCVMAADFMSFIKRQHQRGWGTSSKAVCFHQSIDMLLPTTTLQLFWVDGVGYWLVLGAEPLLNNNALVDLIWGIQAAGKKFTQKTT